MTKQEWQVARSSTNIPMEMWFDYYKDRGGTINDIWQFEQIFTSLIANESLIITNHGQKQITFTSAINSMFNYYDTKFSL